MKEFQGFSASVTQFFWEIRFNNQREWFQAHKQTYLEEVLTPFRRLGEEVYDRFLEAHPDLPLILRVSRIYRDARRLHGRGPYKDNMWFTLRMAGEDWNSHPAFWFGIEPEGWDYGMGIYDAKPAIMARLRRDIDREQKDIVRLARTLAKQDRFHLTGEKYKRPKGNPPAPLDQWYNRKRISLTSGYQPEDRLGSPELEEEVLEGFEQLLPYYHYLQTLCTQGD